MARAYCENMSKSELPGSTRRGNTMPGRFFLRDLQVDAAIEAAAEADMDEAAAEEWDANEVDDDMAAAVDDVQKCQAVSVDADDE